MAFPQVIASAPREAAPALPGTWKLTAGRAITLEPREPGTLKVAHGRMWATYDGPHGGSPEESGDLFISVGEQLRLRAGQRLVVEASNGRAPAFFSWEPLAASSNATAPEFMAVVQPLRDLRNAVVFGGGAIGRLVAGVAQVGWQLLGGGARPGFEERACRRHGAMG